MKRKLIEVALPLDDINRAAAYEKMPGIGPHPRGIHLWWARRPLAAARAVLFAQMVDDPSARPELFPTKEEQDEERERLFAILRELVLWKNTTNEEVLEAARAEIRESWRRTCEDHADHPRAAELFAPEKLPAFHDPFAGGGALPLEAQRLGLEAHASDLNPVAVLINKAMIEIPPRFAGRPPVNPEARKQELFADRRWRGTSGLAEDVRHYGEWMRDEAERQIGDLYPKAWIAPELVAERPDLERYDGRELTVIAWLWARTVRSPDPAFAQVEVPLVSSFRLSMKRGKQAYVEPVVEGDRYRFEVRVGIPPAAAKAGTKLTRGPHFRCLVSDAPMTGGHIKAEGKAGRMGARLLAVVAKGDRERVYLSPTEAMEEAARRAEPTWRPDSELPNDHRNFWAVEYGLKTFGDLFTPRQLVALTTVSDLVGEAMAQARRDAIAAGVSDDNQPLHDGGSGATAYAEAVGVYLAFAVDRCSDFSNACTQWTPRNQKVMHLYGKQAIAMTWDFPEAAILANTVGGFAPASAFIADCLAKLPLSRQNAGKAYQQDAATTALSRGRVVSTDPPYYDNVAYADLSDFFYVWLRRSLKSVFPELFATLATPKSEELVAAPYRQGGKDKSEQFFVRGMRHAISNLAERAHPSYPVTIYYAFKQSETKGDAGTVSTGWETFLDAVIRSGLSITGTWPLRTEQAYRAVGLGTSVLASSIVLVCSKRSAEAPLATRRQLVDALRAELPGALADLQRGNIAPVDLAQAVIGPGMAVFTRYSKVLDASGEPVSVRQALALINEVLDETLSEQEGDFDADTRWALAWFDENGFDEGEYGVAETLSKAKNTSVAGLVEAGVLASKAGRVRLLKPAELSDDWNPATDRRLTVWEMVHHLVRALEEGEGPAADLLRPLGGVAETARELAYRLYAIAEHGKRATEARWYNGLVRSWPEVARRARAPSLAVEQAKLLG